MIGPTPLSSPEDESFQNVESSTDINNALLAHRNDKGGTISLECCGPHKHAQSSQTQCKHSLDVGSHIVIAWRAFRKFEFQASTTDLWRHGM